MSKFAKIALIRGAFLNPWEMQNYEPLKKRFNLTVFSSLRPLDENIDLPLVRLPSPMDLPDFPYKMPILNRTLIDAHWLFGLEKRLKGFDIVHVAETYYAYTHQAVQAKKKGLIKKIISTCWEVIPHNNEGIWGRKRWKKQALKEIDHFICPTEMARRCLIMEGCQAEKTSVIPMGVNLNRFKIYDLRFKNKNKLSILFIGRLEEEKGIWELLKAFKKITKRRNNVFLTMIGDGSQKKEIMDFIKKGKMIQIILPKSRISYEKMNREYQEADIFVLPSKATKTWQEQYGMVLVEAMASGLPIVATKTGAIPEVIDDAGLLVKSGNIVQLTKVLFELVKNRQKRIQLGNKTRKRAEKFFDSRRITEKIEEVYLSHLGSL